MLGKIGHRLGRQALAEVVTVARPDTILAWYRKLVAGKFDGSKARRGPGKPRVTREVEQLIVRMASENRDWGYDRIVGALANLGYVISDQTVGNIPAPPRAGAGAQAYDHMAGLHSDPLGAAGWN
jgi:putative transposase